MMMPMCARLWRTCSDPRDWRSETASAQRFMARARIEPPACLILDVNLPGLSRLDLRQELLDAGIPIPITFLLVGRGGIPISVRAIKAERDEVSHKPFNADDPAKHDSGRDLGDAYPQGVGNEGGITPRTSLTSESSALRAALNRIQVVAPTDSTVLILGGTEPARS